MSGMTDTKDDGVVPTKPTGSDMDPVVVQPGGKADPSTDADWKGHVKEYFNHDTIRGEDLPTASHEAKK